MSDNSASGFRTVMRGYDPSEVDRQLGELNSAVSTERGRADELTSEVARLKQEVTAAKKATDEAKRVRPVAVAPAPPAPPSKPTFADFGERIGRILAIAEEEAGEITAAAVAEARRRMADLETAEADSKSETDRYAQEVRGLADQEAARIVEEAKRSADQMVDEADRQSLARRREAEALYEDQRAKAAKAAADFEQTLAERRGQAEKSFQDRTATAENQLAETQERIAQLRADGDSAAAEASRRAALLTSESEQKAEQIIADAKARADRIRSDSERELAAAVQRRDSINDQLTNVRQMLATLTGNAATALDTGSPKPEA